MYKFSRIVKEYKVIYLQDGIVRYRLFVQVESAIRFARERMQIDENVDIEEIVKLEGWY